VLDFESPIQGLHGVHLRYGLHTRAVTVYRDTLTEGFSHFVISLRLLPAGAVAGWVLHPLESAAFPRRTPGADLQAWLPKWTVKLKPPVPTKKQREPIG
jgi:hypothetical protein